MWANINGKDYTFYIHADASFGPEDVTEIPQFIKDAIDLASKADQAGVTEGVIIPIFAASDEEIGQLESAIDKLNIPRGFPVLIVWVDRNTGEVKGRCVAGCEGMDPQAARAVFGVGLGEIWPHWSERPPAAAEAAAMCLERDLRFRY